MQLAQVVNTFGRAMRRRYGYKVHKLPIDAGFTCPNRDGNRGRGGCTFCNNRSFSPNGRRASIPDQLDTGARIVRRLTRAARYLAYFQAYTNTYAAVEELAPLYDEALRHDDVIGLSVGTRPDCVPDEVLDLLCAHRDRGREVWLELGLQSAFDDSLRRVNRGHGFAEYADAVRRARRRGLQVCTHLIVGLPGERAADSLVSLERVLEHGVDGLKVHPLHVVRGTKLALEWRRGGYRPLALEDYAEVAAEIVRRSPPQIVFHRLTGTAGRTLLLAPEWCAGKWAVLNRIARILDPACAGAAAPAAP
ncbi:MAG: TIGR01212 family radical SAM protein [Gammaproteobacteria bacterium]|nr:TIGR01212 family radical SAM protein [Gammaproteobacteria bacterium]